MTKEILNLLDEDLIVQYDTLAALNKMGVSGVDPVNSAYRRRAKKEFIEQAKADINWTLNLRKKYENQAI